MDIIEVEIEEAIKVEVTILKTEVDIEEVKEIEVKVPEDVELEEDSEMIIKERKVTGITSIHQAIHLKDMI